MKIFMDKFLRIASYLKYFHSAAKFLRINIFEARYKYLRNPQKF